MRRLLPVLLPLVLLAACDTAAPPTGAEAPPGTLGTSPDVRAWFPARGVVDTIEVDTVERLPLRGAALVAPNGAMTQANYINNAANPSTATGQWEVAHPWNAPIAGDSALAGLAAPPGMAGPAVYGQKQLLATVSTADINLPDAVVYRRDWQQYRLRLTFGTTPDETETREIPAPKPPPTD